MTKHAKIWPRIQREAAALRKKEPVLAAFLDQNILTHKTLAGALAHLLSAKLSTREVALKLPAADAKAAERDLAAILDNDPAAKDALTPFLFFKGFHALQAYRAAHALWKKHPALALFIQSRVSERCGVDIHPAAKIGAGVMMDHATGIVIGETAVIEDGVLMWHGVTLGGKGTECGDRHPKIRKGAMLGAGATILGNIEVGAHARVAAGSVVVRKVPKGTTVAGVAAKDVK